MTDENEMTEEVDSAWQPGPAVDIDWYGGKFDDDVEVDCEGEEDIAELGLE